MPSIPIVSRKEWGAKPAVVTDMDPIEPLEHPILYVLFTIDDQYRTPVCKTKEDCIKSVRTLQEHWMEKGLPDIPYNFVVGNCGNVYEGRGWHLKPHKARKHFKFDQKPTMDVGIISGHVNELMADRVRLEHWSIEFAQEFIKEYRDDVTISQRMEFAAFTNFRLY